MDNNQDDHWEKVSRTAVKVAFVMFILFDLVYFIAPRRPINKTSQEDRKNKSDEEERRQYEQDKLEEQQKLEDENNKLDEEIDKIEDEIKKQNEAEEIKRQKEEFEKRREANRHINDNLEDKVVSLGFKKTKECSQLDNTLCYENDTYLVTYMKNINHIEFDRKETVKNIEKYDSKSDLELFEKLYDAKLTKYSELFNKLIRSFKTGLVDSFNVQVENYYFTVFGIVNNIEFISRSALSYTEDDFMPSYLDTSVAYNKKNAYEIRKTFYDISMSYNKKHFKFYDYGDLHFNAYENDNICKIDYTGKNNYRFSSDYCHAGTSNAYYSFNYYDDYKTKNDTIMISVRFDYFSKNYINFIKNDLKYFEKKLNIKFNLTSSMQEKIKKFMGNKDKTISLDINDNMIVKIERNEYNPDIFYVYYEIIMD